MLLVVVATAAFGSLAHAQKPVYRWVDKDGVVHYGDRVPPEYANQDRDILNSQAVAVGFERGALTEEQLAALRQQEAADAAEQQRVQARERRDRMLLDTYLTVQDIENLRDQRLDLLDSRIRVTEQYLDGLRKRLETIDRQIDRIERANEDSDNPRPIPAELIEERSQTLASVSLYEETLLRTQVEQAELRASFAADIQRFVELTDDAF